MHTIFHFLLVYTDWQLVTSQDTVHRKYTSDVHLFSNIMGSPSLTENYMNAPWHYIRLTVFRQQQKNIKRDAL